MSNKTTSDKFLLAIVAGVLLLVVTAFIVIANRPTPQFQDANDPQSVVHDYLLAHQLGESERAYSALSSRLGYPATLAEFKASIDEEPWAFSPSEGYSIIVESGKALTDKSTAVTVRQIYTTNSLFNSGEYSETFQMTVAEEEDGWKIISGDPGHFWSQCWGAQNNCPAQPRPIP